MSAERIEFMVILDDCGVITKRAIMAESYNQLKFILSNLPQYVKWRI
jgi:hypothetical protein